MSFTPPLLAEWLLRGVALSAVAAAAYTLLRPGGRARGTLLALTTFGLLLLPLACLAAPKWTVGWIQLSGQSIAAPGGGSAGFGAGWSIWATLWVLGFATCLIRLAFGIAKVTRLCSSAEEPLHPDARNLLRCASDAAGELGIGMPRISISQGARGPCATGLIRPHIVLPAEATSWSTPVLRAVLLHEMAHIRRGDLWIQAAGNIVGALYWMNPLVWLLLRRLATEREFLADALVIESGIDARHYAHALLDVVSSHPSVPAGAAVAIGLTDASPLEDRIRRLVGGLPSSRGRLRNTALVGIGFLAVAASACIDPFAKAPTRSAQPEPAEDPVWTEEEIEHRLSASPFPGG